MVSYKQFYTQNLIQVSTKSLLITPLLRKVCHRILSWHVITLNYLECKKIQM